MTSEQKKQMYHRVAAQLTALFSKTDDPTARMATAAALLYHKLGHFFWIGFYRLVNDQLLVGPYQGTVACQVLPKDRGVCWTCVNSNRTLIVPDVQQFDGHVACDPRSRSELVVPVHQSGRVMGVLDADSDRLNAFDQVDADGLEQIARLIYAA